MTIQNATHTANVSKESIAVKERPILFSTPMVQALIDGRKTQTRRVIKPQPQTIPQVPMPLNDFCKEMERLTKEGNGMIHTSGAGKGLAFPLCPYGQPGDLLWVREKHYPRFVKGGIEGFKRHYPELHPWIYFASEPDYDTRGHGWKPSIHMPKSAARIWLQVTGVRVERLQDIHEDDARAEGIEYQNRINGGAWKCYKDTAGISKDLLFCIDPSSSFRSLWSSINGPGSWELNPWVWVVEFEVLSTTGRKDSKP